MAANQGKVSGHENEDLAKERRDEKGKGKSKEDEILEVFAKNGIFNDGLLDTVTDNVLEKIYEDYKELYKNNTLEDMNVFKSKTAHEIRTKVIRLYHKTKLKSTKETAKRLRKTTDSLSKTDTHKHSGEQDGGNAKDLKNNEDSSRQEVKECKNSSAKEAATPDATSNAEGRRTEEASHQNKNEENHIGRNSGSSDEDQSYKSSNDAKRDSTSKNKSSESSKTTHESNKSGQDHGHGSSNCSDQISGQEDKDLGQTCNKGDGQFKRVHREKEINKSTDEWQEQLQTDGAWRHESSEELPSTSKDDNSKEKMARKNEQRTSKKCESQKTENSSYTTKTDERQDSEGDDRSKHQEARRSSNFNLKEIEDIESEEEISLLNNRQLKEILVKNKVDCQGILEKADFVALVKRLWTNLKSNDEENGTCSICLTSRVNCVFLECGHSVTCIECGKKIKECPMCRCYVVRIVRIFRS